MNMKFFITIFKHPNTFSICKNLATSYCKNIWLGISRPANWRTID